MGADSRWSNSTHLGTEYAALLVQPGYHPPSKILALPGVGDGIVLVSTVQGSPAPPELSRTVHFSGYDWSVRSTASERGGASIRILQITCASTPMVLYTCALPGRKTGGPAPRLLSLEVSATAFTASRCKTPLLYRPLLHWICLPGTIPDRTQTTANSSWKSHAGDPHSKDAQFVVQTYYVPANVDRFLATPATLTHSFRWQPGKVSFRTVQDSKDKKEGPLVADHEFTSGVPSPGEEFVHMAFYIFGNAPDPVGHESEVVVDKFEYLP